MVAQSRRRVVNFSVDLPLTRTSPPLDSTTIFLSRSRAGLKNLPLWWSCHTAQYNRGEDRWWGGRIFPDKVYKRKVREHWKKGLDSSKELTNFIWNRHKLDFLPLKREWHCSKTIESNFSNLMFFSKQRIWQTCLPDEYLNRVLFWSKQSADWLSGRCQMNYGRVLHESQTRNVTNASRPGLNINHGLTVVNPAEILHPKVSSFDRNDSMSEMHRITVNWDYHQLVQSKLHFWLIQL